MSASEVVKAFEAFRQPDSNISEWNEGGRLVFADQVYEYTSRNKPVEFVMLGYPFKSTNHVHKTLGVLPDLAERASFDNWRKFGDAVRAVYPPGINVNLVSDGFAFNDLLGEADKTVDEYAEVVGDYAKGAPVRLLSMLDFYPTSPGYARDKLTTQFGITDIELEARIISDPNVTMLYNGMARFMEEELEYKTFPSKRQLHLAAKALARKMMLRNEAYSALVHSEFANAIRLSMHKATNVAKYAFQLIPGPESYFSPWHCAVLVHKDGTLKTVHKRDAEAAGWTLVIENERPFFYAEK
jgi:pyoverdine/dityrosine biosynthesis protein Dit1